MAIKDMLRCGICGQRAQAESLKWDGRRQINMCANCMAKEKPAKPEPRVKSQIVERAIRSEKPETESKARYKCNACSYAFSRGSSYDGKTCPYCGKKGTVAARS